MQLFIPPRLYSSDSLYNFPFPIQVLITRLHCPQKPPSYFSLSICTVTPQVNHVLFHLIHEVRHKIARRDHVITFEQQSTTVDKHEQSVDLIRERIPRHVEEEPFVEHLLDQIRRSLIQIVQIISILRHLIEPGTLVNKRGERTPPPCENNVPNIGLVRECVAEEQIEYRTCQVVEALEYRRRIKIYGMDGIASITLTG